MTFVVWNTFTTCIRWWPTTRRTRASSIPTRYLQLQPVNRTSPVLRTFIPIGPELSSATAIICTHIDSSPSSADKFTRSSLHRVWTGPSTWEPEGEKRPHRSMTWTSDLAPMTLASKRSNTCLSSIWTGQVVDRLPRVEARLRGSKMWHCNCIRELSHKNNCVWDLKPAVTSISQLALWCKHRSASFHRNMVSVRGYDRLYVIANCSAQMITIEVHALYLYFCEVTSSSIAVYVSSRIPLSEKLTCLW